MLNPSQVGMYTDIGSRVVILWTGDLKNKKVIVRQGPFLSSGGERLSSWYISSSDSEDGGK